MEIVKLPEGEAAPRESDCISIVKGPDGRFLLNASALSGCSGDDEGEEEDESVAVIGGDSYATYEEAEAAGLAWASECCAEFVYISLNAPNDGDE
jgi:hypothetical protein